MLTTLAGLCLNKRQNRGAGPRTDALQAASEVLKQLGRKATLAVILWLEGLWNLHCGVRAIESLQSTWRTWWLDMHAGFETHGTEHWQQVIKCGFGEKKGIIAKKTTNALQMLPHPRQCFPLHCLWSPTGSHQPLSCSTPRWSGVDVSCKSIIALSGHSCQSHACHQNKLQWNHLTHSSPDRPLAFTPSSHFRLGSLGNLCILVKNGFHCTLRVSSS